MAETNFLNLQDTAWLLTSEDVSTMPPLNFTQSGSLPSYDAYKFAGDYDSGRQKAYAGAVAYRIALPADAVAGTPAEVDSIAVSLYVDRWLIGGVRLAGILSNDSEPPSDWTTLTTGDANQSTQLPELSPRVDQTKTVTITFTAETAMAYLYLIVSLENYTSTSPLDTRRIEGGALIVADSSVVTFSRSVAADPSTQLSVIATNKMQLDGATIDRAVTRAAAAGLVINPADDDDDWKRWEGMLRHWVTGGVTAIADPAQSIQFEFDYAGKTAITSIRIEMFDNKYYNGVNEPDFRPAAVMLATPPETYPGVTPALLVAGTIPDEAWIYAYADNDATGAFIAGQPCGVPHVAPTGIDTTALVGPIALNLFDEKLMRNVLQDTDSVGIRFQPAGFPVWQWTDQVHNITGFSISETGLLLFREVIPNATNAPPVLGRNYIHIGDYLSGSSNPLTPDWSAGFYPQNYTMYIEDHLSAEIGSSAARRFTVLNAYDTTPVAPTVDSVQTPTPLRPEFTFGATDENMNVTGFEVEIRSLTTVGTIEFTNLMVLPPFHQETFRWRIPDELAASLHYIKVRLVTPLLGGTWNYSSWSGWTAFTPVATVAETLPTGAGFYGHETNGGQAVGWADGTLFGHVHTLDERTLTTIQFEDAIASYPTWMTLRLVAYYVALDSNDPFPNLVIADSAWDDPALFYGTLTTLPVVIDGVAEDMTAQPILALDLDPAGYAADTAMAITPITPAGPFLIYLACGPVDINTGATAASPAVGTFYGLEWTPTVAILN
ncbi:MAG: hypothetical protein GY820_39745 [Gammaproteobacteria bacterium]|nr:hypothetical protein [Gammaproteobacteria bacterium]